MLYSGAIYHVTARGNGRQAIFDDDADRERLLERQAFVDYGAVLGQMGRARQARSCRRYVESALAETVQDKDSLRLKAAIEGDLQSPIDVLKCN
ncbi:MAG: hypothetical protein EXS27_02570 [Pedosphaera sp.]|nr:hypothetical protein [Pedosphaera sp.]